MNLTILESVYTRGRCYRLVRIQIDNMSSYKRTKVIRKIMDDYNAIGFIEFYSSRGIVRKDKSDFIGIILSNRESKNL